MKPKRNPMLLFPAIASVLVVLLGAALLLWPDAVVGVFPPMIGTVLLFVGTLTLLHALASFRQQENPWYELGKAAMHLTAGLIFVLKSNLSLAFLTIFFGIYVLASGVMQLAYALGEFRAKKPWTGALLEGLFQILLAALLLFGTFTGNALWARLMGLQFLFTGGSSLVLLMGLREVPEQEAQQKELPLAEHPEDE